MGSHRNPSARDAHTARTAHTASRVRPPVRARPPHEAPAMPRAKGEELRWLVVFKRVVEGTPIGSVAAECRVSQTFVKSMVTLFEQAMQESLRPSSALALSAWRSRIDATLRHRRAIWMPTLCGSSPLGFAGPAGPRWASEAG